MNTLIWILKVNIAIVLLYAFYKLFFQRDTFFKAKRMILLLSLLFALIYPFFDVKELFSKESVDLTMMPLVINLPEFLVTNAVEKPDTLSINNVIRLVWGTGAGLFLIYFIIQIVSILSKILFARKTYLSGVKVYVLKGLKAPFSFFNYILIDPDFHDEQELSEILLHEKTHVKEGHTGDVLLSEFICICCWFNPFAWLMKKEIRINLEFLADNSVMKSVKNTEHYQLHLLRLSYHKAIAQLSNNFNVSPLKKRIQMMNKKKSSSMGMIKYTLFVPLFAGLLFVNNLPAQNNVKKAQVTQSKVVKDVPVGEDVFTHVEEMPKFPGGDAEMMKYLSKNVKYPIEAQELGIEGTVVCRFIVSSTGEVKDVNILRSANSIIDNEALRVVSAMPKWIPGKQGGKAVDVYYTLPVRFRLSKDDSTKKEIKSFEELPEGVIVEVEGKIISKKEMDKISTDQIESINVIKEGYEPGKGKIIVKLKK